MQMEVVIRSVHSTRQRNAEYCVHKLSSSIEQIQNSSYGIMYTIKNKLSKLKDLELTLINIITTVKKCLFVTYFQKYSSVSNRRAPPRVLIFHIFAPPPLAYQHPPPFYCFQDSPFPLFPSSQLIFNLHKNLQIQGI